MTHCLPFCRRRAGAYTVYRHQPAVVPAAGFSFLPCFSFLDFLSGRSGMTTSSRLPPPPSMTIQRLVLEIGACSSMRTTSPTLWTLSASWAWYFFERRTVFLNKGCVKRRSTRTTTVLSCLSLITTPCSTRLGMNPSYFPFAFAFAFVFDFALTLAPEAFAVGAGRG